MFNLNKIKATAASLYTDASKAIKQYTPESFSKEKKFVNAAVIGLVLMTVADKKVDTEEVVESINVINNLDEIKELNMETEAISLFEIHLEKISAVMDNTIKFTIEVSRLIADLQRVKEYPEYAPVIAGIVEHISSADGELDPLEIEMKERIEKALS